MRTSTINRKTAETDISLTLNLDGSGISEIHSGCGFLDHMLTLFARHGGFDLTLTCKGDTYVDDHHTVEDIGICLGKALTEALGFEVLPSLTNFVFAKTDRIGGEALYLELKRRGILVRHFGKAEITDYNRITIGTREQMEAFISTVKTILEELS